MKKTLLPLIALVFAMPTAFSLAELTPVTNSIQSPHAKVITDNLGDSKSLTDKIKESLAGFAKDVSISTCVLEIPIESKFVSLNSKYCVKISPSYLGGTLYNRRDEYVFPFDLDAGKWKFSNNEALLFNISQDTRLRVYRIFDSFSEALRPPGSFLLLDWVVDYLPSSAERILEKMQPGEMVNLQIPLTVSASFPLWDAVKNAVNVTGKISKSYVGLYDIFVFRGDNNKIRLRVLPKNDEAYGFDFKARISKDGFSTPQELLLKLLGGDGLVHLYGYKGEKNLFVADYTLDFNNADVREAYNNLFSKALSLSNIEGIKEALKQVSKLAMPKNQSHEMLRKSLVTNLNEIERLAYEDLDLQPDSRRILINVNGSNSPDGFSFGGTIGLPILGKMTGEVSKFNHALTRRYPQKQNDGSWQEKKDYYLFPSWAHRKHSKSRLFKHEEEVLRSLNIIHLSDEKLETPKKFSSIGFNYDSKDNDYTAHDHTSFIQHLKNILPARVFDAIYNDMSQKKLGQISKTLGKTKTVLRYFINEDGLESVEKRFSNKSTKQTEAEILSLIVKYVRQTDVFAPSTNSNSTQANLDTRCLAAGISNDRTKNDVATDFCVELLKITEKLAIIVNSNESPSLREKSMEDLLWQPLFRAIGPGFLFSLLPAEEFNKSVKIEIRFYLTNNITPVMFDYGSAPDRELYEELMQQQSILTEEEPDLRIPGQSNSRTTKIIEKFQ